MAYYFLEAVNFKVMKTIRNQLKYPIGLRLAVLLKMGIKNCWYSIFMWLQKEQQIDNKTKNQLSFARKGF